MKRICWLLMVVCCLAAAGSALAVPQAMCVRWHADEARPHATYSGATITLKGIARGGATEFRWDYGDGGGTGWAPITNPYNLGVQHSYAGLVGTEFSATLHVRDAVQEATDTYPIKIYKSTDLSVPEEFDIRRDMSIDEGLWYLHTTLIRATYGGGSPGYGEPYGYWLDTTYGYHVAATGPCVDAFQVNGHKLIGDYDGDPYVETVRRSTNYLLVNTYSYSIGLQPAGDPDCPAATNPDAHNGIGLVTNYTSGLSNTRQTYIGGICMTTLASSASPNYIAPVGGSYVYGRSIRNIVQDMIDFFAWGQVDSGSGRGGWRYYANYVDSDMSTAQWPPLGMQIAVSEMSCVVPAFVGSELVIFLNATQSNDMDNDNGGFGYSYEDLWNNITKTAAGLICHELIGTPWNDPRIEKALGFIYRHWNDTGTDWDHTKLHGNSYGMYGVMKAFRIPNPDVMQVIEYDYLAGHQTANNFNWYYTPAGQANQGLATYIVGTQQADGSWDDSPGPNPVRDAFCTGWRILTLAWVTIPPKAVICRCGDQDYDWNQDVIVDGSCSYHPDPDRQIVKYEWDWDYSGVFVPDDVGVQATKVGGYPATGLYPVALRVTDDKGQMDMTICGISVHPPPHCPRAWAFPVQGGHYIGWINVPVTLDASSSWDPNGDPLIYEWDLDGDGQFDDATGPNPTWTWTSDGTFPVGLRVTDIPNPQFAPCSETDFTTAEIGNHAPAADPNGPYTKSKGNPDPCLILDGTGSYDPDPGDFITYAWDLNADGVFGDCTQPTCQFCIEPDATIGEVYDIRLQVTDSLGKSDTKSTTVTVIANQAPTVICSGDLTAECTCFGGAQTAITATVEDLDGDALTARWYVDDALVETDLVPGTPPVTTAQVQLDYLFPLGTHTVRIVVDDGEESAECTMEVMAVDTTAPEIVSCVAPKLLFSEFGALVPLPDYTSELVARDIADPSLQVTQDPAPGFLLSLGTRLIKYTVRDDSGNTAECVSPIEVRLANHSPNCSKAYPSISQIWPPKSSTLKSVTIKGVTDPDGDPVKITITSIFQDEPVKGQCTGDLSPDGFGIGTNTAKLRAERGTKANGRVYTITFIAEDPKGGSCTNVVKVGVPRSIFPYLVCVDGGPLYDSTKK